MEDTLRVHALVPCTFTLSQEHSPVFDLIYTGKQAFDVQPKDAVDEKTGRRFWGCRINTNLAFYPPKDAIIQMCLSDKLGSFGVTLISNNIVPWDVGSPLWLTLSNNRDVARRPSTPADRIQDNVFHIRSGCVIAHLFLIKCHPAPFAWIDAPLSDDDIKQELASLLDTPATTPDPLRA